MRLVVALAFVLAAVFVVTECQSTPAERFAYADCYNGLRDCAEPLYNNPLIARLEEENDLFFENIDQICELYETTATCLRPHVHSCDSELEKILTAASSIGDFVCSEEGRSLIREYESSVCYNSQDKDLELQAIPEVCLVEIATKTSYTNVGRNVRCEILSDILACLAYKTSELCGQAAGHIVRGVTDGVVAIYTQDECNVHSVSEFVRRNVALVKKATKKRESDNFESILYTLMG